MDKRELIQIKDDILYDHFFVYKNKQYPIMLDFIKKNSQYFQKNQEEIEKNKFINLIDENSEKNIDIPDAIIQNFIDFLHCKTIELNNENVLILNYLSNKYEVPSLLKFTNEYINKHQKEDDLEFLLINQKNKSIETNTQEIAISQNFLKYINDDRLLHLDFPVLYRILDQYKKQTKQEKMKDKLIDFYFKCLDNYGSDASVLFSDVDFSNEKSEYLKRIINEYSKIFDFHYINFNFTKSIYQIQNELLSVINEMKAKLQENNESIEKLQSQTTNLKKSLKLKEECIKSMKNEIDQLKKSQIETKNPLIKNNQDDEISDLKKSIKNLTKTNKEMKEKIDEQNIKIDKLFKEINNLRQSSTVAKGKSNEKTVLYEEENPPKTKKLSKTTKLFTSYDNNIDTDDEYEEANESIKNGIIKPFGIKNVGNSSYINSSLQCFLSLPLFIGNINNLIAKNNTHQLLTAFKSFIASHSPYKIKQILTEKNISFYRNSQQDSFDFTISFINKLSNETIKGAENLFTGKCQNIIKCTKCKEETIKEQDFSSISFSIQNSRNVLYIPFSMKGHPLQMAQKPESSTNVKLIESKYTTFSIGDYILMAKESSQFKPINDVDLHYSNIYAFELPETTIKKGNGYIVIQIKNLDNTLITSPFICEVPLFQNVEKEELIRIILKRLKESISIVYQNQNDEIKQFLEISKPTKFPFNFETISETSMICNSYVNVKVYKDDIFNFSNRSKMNQKIDLSLENLFNSHIQRSQLEPQRKFTCDSCERRSRVYKRIKYTKLPKILIFHMKRTKDDTFNSALDETRVCFPSKISIGVDGDFNKFVDQLDEDGSTKYQLMAISHHIGSFSGGRYWADGKRGEKWFNFNDSQVQPISEPNEGTGSSYIAFYQQMS